MVLGEDAAVGMQPSELLGFSDPGVEFLESLLQVSGAPACLLCSHTPPTHHAWCFLIRQYDVMLTRHGSSRSSGGSNRGSGSRGSRSGSHPGGSGDDGLVLQGRDSNSSGRDSWVMRQSDDFKRMVGDYFGSSGSLEDTSPSPNGPMGTEGGGLGLDPDMGQGGLDGGMGMGMMGGGMGMGMGGGVQTGELRPPSPPPLFSAQHRPPSPPPLFSAQHLHYQNQQQQPFLQPHYHYSHAPLQPSQQPPSGPMSLQPQSLLFTPMEQQVRAGPPPRPIHALTTDHIRGAQGGGAGGPPRSRLLPLAPQPQPPPSQPFAPGLAPGGLSMLYPMPLGPMSFVPMPVAPPSPASLLVQTPSGPETLVKVLSKLLVQVRTHHERSPLSSTRLIALDVCQGRIEERQMMLIMNLAQSGDPFWATSILRSVQLHLAGDSGQFDGTTLPCPLASCAHRLISSVVCSPALLKLISGMQVPSSALPAFSGFSYGPAMGMAPAPMGIWTMPLKPMGMGGLLTPEMAALRTRLLQQAEQLDKELDVKRREAKDLRDRRRVQEALEVMREVSRPGVTREEGLGLHNGVC
jgi:hypothetical protein